MQMHQLKRKNALKKKRYVGRGGKRGTTAGRGTKGQKARAGHRIRPEIRDLIKKLPKRRGRGKNVNTSVQEKPAILKLDLIERGFAAGEVVSPKILVTKGLVSRRGGAVPAVKILAGKALSKKVIIDGCLVSATARVQIEQAGGTIK